VAALAYDIAQETKKTDQKGQKFVFGLGFTVEYEQGADKVGENYETNDWDWHRCLLVGDDRLADWA
jgi:hypothetical protein